MLFDWCCIIDMSLTQCNVLLFQRTRASSRRRASANNSVIDLTCDPDSDSDGEVLIIGTTPAPVAVPLAEPDVSRVHLQFAPWLTTVIISLLIFC